jgi:hypothetical protein
MLKRWNVPLVAILSRWRVKLLLFPFQWAPYLAHGIPGEILLATPHSLIPLVGPRLGIAHEICSLQYVDKLEGFTRGNCEDQDGGLIPERGQH